LPSVCIAVRVCCRPCVLPSVSIAVRVYCRPCVLPSVCIAVRVYCRPCVLPSVCVAVRVYCRPCVLPSVSIAVRVYCRLAPDAYPACVYRRLDERLARPHSLRGRGGPAARRALPPLAAPAGSACREPGPCARPAAMRVLPRASPRTGHAHAPARSPSLQQARHAHAPRQTRP
jgi:hypothetical protein